MLDFKRVAAIVEHADAEEKRSGGDTVAEHLEDSALDRYDVVCVLQKCNAICVLPSPPIPVKTTTFWPGSLLTKQSSIAFSSDSRPKKAGVAGGMD